ncbi:MAG: acyltransferase [Maricaulaceae bacterium]
MKFPLPPKLQSIQAFRGIAAFIVMLYHIGERQIMVLNANKPIVTDGWLLSGPWRQGYAGVDLFFLISGFIMVYVSCKGGRSVRDVGGFLYRRIVRIYPLWWVFASIMGVYFYLAYGLWGAPDLKGGATPDFSYFVRSLLLIPQESFPVLRLGWTLIHEMQFYLIFAVLLFLPRKFLVPSLLVWAGIVFLGFALGWTEINGTFSILFSLLSLEFIVGAILAWLLLKGRAFAPKALFWVGVVLSLLAFFFYTDKSSDLTRWGRVAVYTLPFAALIYGAAGQEINGTLKCPKWLVTLGDWSYSLYLVHYLVMVVVVRIGRLLGSYAPDDLVATLTIGAPGIWDNLVFTLATVILSLIAAAISYRLIEQPTLKIARRLKFDGAAKSKVN